jgi:hypothetical protein
MHTSAALLSQLSYSETVSPPDTSSSSRGVSPYELQRPASAPNDMRTARQPSVPTRSIAALMWRPRGSEHGRQHRHTTLVEASEGGCASMLRRGSPRFMPAAEYLLQDSHSRRGPPDPRGGARAAVTCGRLPTSDRSQAKCSGVDSCNDNTRWRVEQSDDQSWQQRCAHPAQATHRSKLSGVDGGTRLEEQACDTGVSVEARGVEDCPALLHWHAPHKSGTHAVEEVEEEGGSGAKAAASTRATARQRKSRFDSSKVGHSQPRDTCAPGSGPE